MKIISNRKYTAVVKCSILIIESLYNHDQMICSLSQATLRRGMLILRQILGNFKAFR